MDIRLYNTSSPPNKVYKIVDDTNAITLTDVQFMEDDALNVITPRIKAKIFTDIEDIKKYNYAHLFKFDRYYYIENITTEAGLVIFHLRVDVLMSFKDTITDTYQYLIRSEKYRNRYLVDNLLPIHSDTRYTIKPFGEAVSDPSCNHVILETIGKGGTPS